MLSRIFSLSLIFVGLLCIFLGSYFLWIMWSPKPLPVARVHAASSSDPLLPTEIIIPSLSLDLPIIPSHRSGNTWETTTKGVSYLTSSPRPSLSGNAIFYGHNWPSLLGKLHNIKSGQVIQLKLSNGTIKTFVVTHIESVSPSDVHLLNQTTKKQITLYTCTSLFDSQRLFVVAQLQNK